MEWAAKPGYSSWLSEEDLVKFHPKEAKEYLDLLRREESRRLSGIIKKAGIFINKRPLKLKIKLYPPQSSLFPFPLALTHLPLHPITILTHTQNN